MDSSLLQQTHRPYRRGERRRKLFVPAKGTSPPHEDMLAQHTFLREAATPVRGLVLVIEPEASLRWSLGSALVHQGFSVAEAATLARAVALLRWVAFDIVVLDLGVLDGVDQVLLQRLSDATALTTPLILLPARLPLAEQGTLLPLGTELPQPSWLEALLRVVTRIGPASDSKRNTGSLSEVEAASED